MICTLFWGCTSKMGSFSDETHFSYPNSNVKPLGKVSVSITKSSFFIPPILTSQDARKLMHEALRQEAGADMIINYSIDTQYTSIFFYHKSTTILEGTAVTMEIGKQIFKETIDQIEY